VHCYANRTSVPHFGRLDDKLRLLLKGVDFAARLVRWMQAALSGSAFQPSAAAPPPCICVPSLDRQKDVIASLFCVRFWLESRALGYENDRLLVSSGKLSM